MKCLLCILAGLMFGSPIIAPAAVTFDLTFQDVLDHTSVNWDDPNYGAQARAVLQTSLDEFGSHLNEVATVSLIVTSSLSSSDYADARAGAINFRPALPEKRFVDGSVYIKITTGVDINGSNYDGRIEFNFNFSALGFPDLNGDGVVDIQDFILSIPPVARHELLHLLGMYSDIAGTTFGTFHTIIPPSRHDTFLHDSAGNAFVNPDGTWSSLANINDPDSYFAALGGIRYKISSEQSDFNHLDPIMFPSRASIDADDESYLRTLDTALGLKISQRSQ